MIKQEEMRITEIQLEVVTYLENGTPVVVWKDPNPAELYVLPRNWGNYVVK